MKDAAHILRKILEAIKEAGALCRELADAKDARVTAMDEAITEAEELLEAYSSTPAPKKAKAASGGITEGTNGGRVPTTPQSKRVADIFHRRHTTPWSEKEIRAYKKLGAIPEEDLKALEAYYASDAQFLRRDLYTFLNNFSGEVDRAHAWKKEQRTQTRSTFTA